MKKYYIRQYNEYGQLIFCHSSDKACTIIHRYNKESRDSSGATYCAYYFGRMETNIDEDTWCRVTMCGEKI